MALQRYLSNPASSVLCAVYSVKDHHILQIGSPLLRTTCVRQVVLDKWLPLQVARRAMWRGRRRVDRKGRVYNNNINMNYIYTCVYIYIYVYPSLTRCVYVCIYVYIYIYTHIYDNMHYAVCYVVHHAVLRTPVCTHTHTPVAMYALSISYVCVCIYIYIHTHITHTSHWYIYIYIYIYSHISVWPPGATRPPRRSAPGRSRWRSPGTRTPRTART